MGPRHLWRHSCRDSMNSKVYDVKGAIGPALSAAERGLVQFQEGAEFRLKLVLRLR